MSTAESFTVSDDRIREWVIPPLEDLPSFAQCVKNMGSECFDMGFPIDDNPFNPRLEASLRNLWNDGWRSSNQNNSTG